MFLREFFAVEDNIEVNVFRNADAMELCHVFMGTERNRI